MTVLVLRALNLGDLLVAVPALSGLRRRYPEHRLVLAASEALEPVAALTGAVDEVLPQRGLHPPAIPSPDVAVDLHGVLPQSIRAFRTTRPGRLVAFACPETGHHDGPPLREIEHETAKWCRLVAWDGAPARPDDLLLAAPDIGTPRPAATVVHPGARYGSKRWPPDRFAAVARHLTARGHDVVIIGTVAERSLAGGVAAAADLPGPAVLAGGTNLRQLLGLIAAARLVVSGDTGVAHLATAYDRPSVVIFGPASPRIWGPPAKDHHAALWHGTHEREVLTDVPDPALLAVTAAEVIKAADQVTTPVRPAAAG